MPPMNLLQSGAPAMAAAAPQGMPAGAMPPPGSGMPQGAPAAPPSLAPTHAQTVAGLVHFQAIENQLRVLMQNPKFGKDDIKSEVLDGFVRLIGSHDLQPTEAVETIKDFPTAPGLQKQWVEGKFMAVNQARQLMLAHRQAAATQEDPNAPPAAWSADSHADHMTGLLGHYKIPAPGA